jgi:hypothetical protein
MKEAIQEKAAFQLAFDELNAAVTEQHRATWQAEVELWENNPNDRSIANPFEAKTFGTCLPRD